MPPVMHYPVMEHFLTLQGEGAFSGQVAYFIRLGGCNVGCHWCDVKESWPADAHPTHEVPEMVEWARASGAPRAVITGGEPTLHNLLPLTTALRAAGIATHLETAGTNPLTGQWTWVTFSPKKFKSPLPEYYTHAHELKVVVHNRHDLQWAEGHAERMPPAAVLFLQPEWFTPASASWVVEYVLHHPHWRVSLQTHKYLQIP